MSQHTHQTHPAIIKRLKRVQGHLKSVISMMEDERECVELAQQLHAIEKAVCQAKRTLIQDHIDHCLDEATHRHSHGKTDPLQEFKEITKYL